jgi:sugar/nucleoside kinase (ribokinase family)
MTRAGATIPGPPIATVTMNPSIDQHILIDRLVKDDAIRARDIRRDPGGKGINVSRVLTELGAETLAFGLTGGGAGYMVKSLLHERGIAFVSVDVLEETRINFIFTDRSDRTQTRISSPGPWVTLDEADRLAALVLGQSRGASGPLRSTRRRALNIAELRGGAPVARIKASGWRGTRPRRRRAMRPSAR